MQERLEYFYLLITRNPRLILIFPPGRISLTIGSSGTDSGKEKIRLTVTLTVEFKKFLMVTGKSSKNMILK